MSDVKKKKRRKFKRRIINIFILLCFTASAVLLYQAVVTKLDENKSNEIYSEIEKIYDDSIKEFPPESLEPEPTENPDATPSDEPEPTQTPAATAEPTPEPTVAPEQNNTIPQLELLDRTEILSYFNSLLDVNEDIRGYIKIPGTNISYPVVQGLDNVFYLKRNIYGKKTISASIFMDYRNNPNELDDNTIVYGHNLNSTMFNDLDYFVDDETMDTFFQTSGIIRFDTAYKIMSWEIYSAYIVDKDDFNYLITNFNTAGDRQRFIDETILRSFTDTGIEVSPDDKILTLSTCNHWFNDSRTVIHARLIEN